MAPEFDDLSESSWAHLWLSPKKVGLVGLVIVGFCFGIPIITPISPEIFASIFVVFAVMIFVPLLVISIIINQVFDKDKKPSPHIIFDRYCISGDYLTHIPQKRRLVLYFFGFGLLIMFPLLGYSTYVLFLEPTHGDYMAFAGFLVVTIILIAAVYQTLKFPLCSDDVQE